MAGSPAIRFARRRGEARLAAEPRINHRERVRPIRNPARILVALVLALLPLGVAAGVTAAPGSATKPLTQLAPAKQAPQKPKVSKNAVDFASKPAVIDLQYALAPYQVPEPDGSRWYLVSAVNKAPRTATRIIVAEEPSYAGLTIFPRRARPAVQQIASSEAGVTVERARAYGRRAFRVSVPPATSVSLAIRLTNAGEHPEVSAWAEGALASQSKQYSIFVAAVAGLIAASLAIAAGLAVMTGHAAPRWAAMTLLMIFLVRLSSTGIFDMSWTTAVGGPYGLVALFEGLALASAIRLADTIVPFASVWPFLERWMRPGLYGICGLAVLAFLGVPGMALLTQVLLVVGATAVAAYLVHRGRLGAQAARVAAPAAAVFALVTAAAAIAALGGFAGNPMAPAMTGGFAAAGAVLLALAVAAGEGIAILPAMRVVPAPQPVTVTPAPRPEPARIAAPVAPVAPVTTAALQAIGASHQGVFELDFRRDVVKLSAEAAALIGFPSGAQSFPHVSWIARVHPDDRDVYKAAIGDYRAHPGLAFRIEFRVRSETGRFPWFELRATMMGEGPHASRCLGLMADVTTRKESEAANIERTLRDSLTGLGNRVALMEALENLGDGFDKSAFALLDIDRFKSIHASLGDAGGDAVLVGVAQRLSKRYQGVATIFRVGGDGFAVLLADHSASLEAVGNDLAEISSAPFPYRERNVFAPVSVGVAAGRDASDPLDLLKNAELALQEAKRAGGACARSYTRGQVAAVAGDPVQLDTELRNAEADGQLELYYQPIIRLEDGHVAGFEGLMRWNHPQRGVLEPSDFLPHCEETGLIVSVGRFALERAAQDLEGWQKNFPLEPPLFASVNLSPRQLSDEDFCGILENVLKARRLATGTLKLELTETTASSGAEARATLSRIHALGAGISIDDFGTGFSALSQLKDLPFDTVKIDKTFLSRSPNGGNEADVILGSIVSLVHGLGRSVVVEGVEHAADAERLKELGCEYAQGYYFGSPLPAADALKFIARHYRAQDAVPRTKSV